MPARRQCDRQRGERGFISGSWQLAKQSAGKSFLFRFQPQRQPKLNWPDWVDSSWNTWQRFLSVNETFEWIKLCIEYAERSPPLRSYPLGLERITFSPSSSARLGGSRGSEGSCWLLLAPRVFGVWALAAGALDHAFLVLATALTSSSRRGVSYVISGIFIN